MSPLLQTCLRLESHITFEMRIAKLVFTEKEGVSAAMLLSVATGIKHLLDYMEICAGRHPELDRRNPEHQLALTLYREAIKDALNEIRKNLSGLSNKSAKEAGPRSLLCGNKIQISTRMRKRHKRLRQAEEFLDFDASAETEMPASSKSPAKRVNRCMQGCGSGFVLDLYSIGSVDLDPDPYSQWIRIRIQEGKNDPQK
jgi:hypothetical protein